jgi:hypothetical protein
MIKEVAASSNVYPFEEIIRTVNDCVRALNTAESANTSYNSAMVPCLYYKSEGWTCSMKLLEKCGDSVCMLQVARHQ